MCGNRREIDSQSANGEFQKNEGEGRLRTGTAGTAADEWR